MNGLTVTVTSKRTVIGTASEVLGGITISAISKRTVIGTTSNSLGGLTISAIGKSPARIQGTGSIALGNLSIYAATPARPSRSMRAGGRPRIVTVVRRGDDGDPAHYARQIVKRPWQ